MPCDSVRSTPVVFNRVAYTPGHAGTLITALEDIGFSVRNSQLYKRHTSISVGEGLVITPKNEYGTRENTITYLDGQFWIPEPLQSRFTVERVQSAYAMRVAEDEATENGWQFERLSETEFEMSKESLYA